MPQENPHARGDRSGLAAGGSGGGSRRRLPQGEDQPGDVLSLETDVYRVGVSELRELRQLREEVGRLKRLEADLCQQAPGAFLEFRDDD
jgi:hypothetical protein